jgi:hypothetical protein
MSFKAILLPSLSALALLSGPAWAAAADKSTPEQTPSQERCQAGAKTPDQDNLSDKLDDCSGVLRPSVGIDPGIKAPAPDPNPGTTPVIRPDTSTVQPK